MNPNFNMHNPQLPFNNEANIVGQKNNNEQNYEKFLNNNFKEEKPFQNDYQQDAIKKKIVNTPNQNNKNYENKNEINQNFITPTPNPNIIKVDNNNTKINYAPKENQQISNNLNNLNLETNITFKRYKKPPLVCLINDGNTTYINVIIQSLANIRPIPSHYLKKENYFKNYANDMALSYYFSRIIIHLYPYPEDRGEKFYSLSTFKKVLLSKNPIFKGKTTKNAIDFLVYFLDILHDDDKKMPYYNNQDNIDNSLKEDINNNINLYTQYLTQSENSCIFNTFGWIEGKKKICWECKKEYINYQKYFTFDLNFELALNKSIVHNNKQEISILDCIKYQLGEQILYNVFCENCQKKCNFDSKISIYSSANVFIFLIRINDNKEIIGKIKNSNIKIKVEEEINLNGLVENQISFANYKLHCLIAFDLNEKLGYIAYCCNPIDQNWYKYEGDNYKKVELAEILNIKDGNLLPVILFYRHN